MKKRTIGMMGGLAAVLLIYLLLANGLMSFFSKDIVPQEVSFEKFQPFKRVFGAVDAADPGKDIFETVDVQGWAFVETTEDNANRFVSLVLKSETQCYEIAFQNVDDGGQNKSLLRPDVKSAYSELDLDSNTLVGFLQRFSSYSLRPGVYDMYIYCWENETAYGLAHTAKQAVKDNSGISFRPWQSVAITLEKRPAEDTARCALDTVSIENGVVTAKGWIFQPDLDCGDQSVYFDVNGTTYTALSVSRPDVASGYGNELYAMSGYSASIPVENIPEGEFTVRLLVENGGGIYSGRPIAVVRNGDAIEKKS